MTTYYQLSLLLSVLATGVWAQVNKKINPNLRSGRKLQQDTGCHNSGYENWSDNAGDSCAWYEDNAGTCAVAHIYVSEGTTSALQVCCVCTDCYKPGYEGWTDNAGDSCEWYEQTPGSCDVAHTHVAEGSTSAQDACCVCDNVAPSNDQDEGCYNPGHEGWTDDAGDSCNWYEQTPGSCDVAHTYVVEGSTSARDACCVCDNVTPSTNPGDETADDQDPQFHSGVGAILRSYDIFRANPLSPSGTDPGFGDPIFASTYHDQGRTPDNMHPVPDGMSLRECGGSCSVETSSNVMNEFTKYVDTLKNKVKVDVGGEYFGTKASFSASVEYKNVKELTLEKNYTIVHAEASCCLFEADLVDYDLPQFDPAFVTALQSLEGKDPSSQEFVAFFSAYGTHYIRKANMGSSMTHQAFFSSESVKEAQDEEIDLGVAAKLKYKKIVDFSTSFSNEKERKDYEFFQQKSTSTSTVTRGSTPPSDFAVSTWIGQSTINPAAISMDLRRIDFLDLPVSEETKTKLTMAIDGYCEALAQSGTVDSCNPVLVNPVDPTPSPTPQPKPEVKYVDNTSGNGLTASGSKSYHGGAHFDKKPGVQAFGMYYDDTYSRHISQIRLEPGTSSVGYTFADKTRDDEIHTFSRHVELPDGTTYHWVSGTTRGCGQRQIEVPNGYVPILQGFDFLYESGDWWMARIKIMFEGDRIVFCYHEWRHGEYDYKINYALVPENKVAYVGSIGPNIRPAGKVNDKRNLPGPTGANQYATPVIQGFDVKYRDGHQWLTKFQVIINDDLGQQPTVDVELSDDYFNDSIEWSLGYVYVQG